MAAKLYTPKAVLEDLTEIHVGLMCSPEQADHDEAKVIEEYLQQSSDLDLNMTKKLLGRKASEYSKAGNYVAAHLLRRVYWSLYNCERDGSKIILSKAVEYWLGTC